MRSGEPRRGGFSGGRRNSFGRDSQRGRDRDRGGSGGPHFPTSRFIGDNKEERFRK